MSKSPFFFKQGTQVMSSLKSILKNPTKILSWIIGNVPILRNNLSDETYLRIKYRGVFGEKLHLDNPISFNEKIQWLKLFGDYENAEKWVDKYEFKKIIEHVFGSQYIIPTLGVWNTFDEINFKELPQKFVLKCTHDSGGVVICKDKSIFNLSNARKIIEDSLKKNFYCVGREKPYKNVKPRIIAEQLMEDTSGELVDYKIHVFNGIPKFILVCSDRFSKSGLKEDFFDTEWNHLDVSRFSHPNAQKKILKPSTFEAMLNFSKTIGQKFKFVRTDFYEINGQLYFGEVTFFPASGFEKFNPQEWDLKFGSFLTL